MLPRNLSWILTGVLVATLAFMCIMNGDIGWSMIGISAVIFAIACALSFLMTLSVEVTEDGVTMKYLFRTYVYPRSEIIDKRAGALEDIRNYSQWDLKGVSRKSFLRTGEDDGVALKLMGKRIVVISSSDASSFLESVPLEIAEEADS